MLVGKTVLITGASSGLGEHFARLCVKAGANVVIAARRYENLKKLANELRASLDTNASQKIFPVAMDVTDVASIRGAFAEAEKAVGTSNVIVNNSGIANPKISVDMDVDDW
jgi:NADP-dependent 3-hydroxy acid dehydrogenase YdfG